MKRILVPVANQIEDIELAMITDVLRRSGAEVIVASIYNHQEVVLSRKLKIIADGLLQEYENEHFDLIVLPGGMPGSEYFRDDERLIRMLKKQRLANRYIAAICAAPVVVLDYHRLVDGVQITFFPGFDIQFARTDYAEQAVVVDQNVITSQGPATAMVFVLKLVEILFGKQKAEAIGKGLLYKKTSEI